MVRCAMAHALKPFNHKSHIIFPLHRTDEIFSVTQTIQQEEIEQEEVIEHSQESIQTTTVCVDEAGDIIEEDGEIEEEEEDEEAVFALALSEDSECEDKEYMGKLARMHFHSASKLSPN